MKVAVALCIKGNKRGLRDAALKKAVDEYQERLAGAGKTRAEALDEHEQEIDEKLMARLAGVRKKLRSAEMSRRRLTGLLASAKAEVGVAHGRRHVIERERNQLLKDYRRERAAVIDAVAKNQNLQELNWQLLRHKPTGRELEIWCQNKSLCGELQALRAQLRQRTEQLTAAETRVAELEEEQLTQCFIRTCQEHRRTLLMHEARFREKEQRIGRLEAQVRELMLSQRAIPATCDAAV